MNNHVNSHGLLSVPRAVRQGGVAEWNGYFNTVPKPAGPCGICLADRVEVSTGRRSPFQTIDSQHTKENTYFLLMTPDGCGYAYVFQNTLNDICLVEGLE